MEAKQHVQLPNGMGDVNLRPYDQLVYVAIKAYDGNGICFPSIGRLSEDIGLSRSTIKRSISSLQKTGYLRVERKGNKNYYIFNKYKYFEPFSLEFIRRKDITPLTKAYVLASQQHMFTDTEGEGRMSYSNYEHARLLNISEGTIRKCDRELMGKNLIRFQDNRNTDLVTGCRTKTKIFNLSQLGQAVIWKLKEHEERINENTEDIERLKKDAIEKDRVIRMMQEEIRKLKERKVWKS